VLGSRLAVALFITANVAVASGTSGGPFNATPVMAALLVLLSPIPAAALQTSRMFRLNESLAASLHAVSVCASLLMVVVVPVAAAGLGYTAGGIGELCAHQVTTCLALVSALHPEQRNNCRCSCTAAAGAWS
jgi:hypothetical protein